MHKYQIGDIFYRYEAIPHYSGYDEEDSGYLSRVDLICHSYVVRRVTPKCVYVYHDWQPGEKRVLIGARKQWANPTKELALDAFIARRSFQLRYLERDREIAQQALDKAKVMRDGQRSTRADPDISYFANAGSGADG